MKGSWLSSLHSQFLSAGTKNGLCRTTAIWYLSPWSLLYYTSRIVWKTACRRLFWNVCPKFSLISREVQDFRLILEIFFLKQGSLNYTDQVWYQKRQNQNNGIRKVVSQSTNSCTRSLVHKTLCYRRKTWIRRVKWVTQCRLPRLTSSSLMASASSQTWLVRW